ncbi:hypothetical protein [Streptomyces sp. NPDC001315]|uniref:hypothetical protein n=1 Tax=Streptomyces sp. NPDC001315 TaxID=3364562 RepID=UPI0036AAE18E
MFGLPWVMGFFHQDVYHDGPNPAAVVTYHLVEDLAPESVLLVRRDAQRLVEGLAATQIEAIWQECTDSVAAFFGQPGVEDGTSWMRHLVVLCDAWLSRCASRTELAQADLYDGSELASRVLAAVGEYQPYLASDAGDALSAAVTSCTPDLAFRLLLQALPRASRAPLYFTITSDQHASLVELAEAFDYGEYALSDLDAVIDK